MNTSQQVGGALGLAVLATFSTTHTASLRADGHSFASSLTSGFHLAFVIGAALVVGAIALASTVLRPTPEAVATESESEHVTADATYIEEAA